MSVDRRTLAAIHIAKKDRRLDDDSYRDLLERIAGVRSAADLDEVGARRVMAEFERLGFEKPSKPSRAPADRRPIVRKAQAMWIALWNLDEVDSSHDKALAAFAKKITHKDALRFATNGELGKVIEALKDWLKRVGADPDTTHALLDPLRALVFEQGLRLADGAAPEIYEEFAGRVRRRVTFGSEELRALANEMGTVIRRLDLGARHKQPPHQPQGARNGQSQARTDQR